MERRLVLQGIGAGLLVGAGLAIGADPKKGPAAKNAAVEQLQRTWKSLLGERRQGRGRCIADRHGPTTSGASRSTRRAYAVLRHEGTERPFSSPLNDEHRAGVFVCAGCALPLFTSAMKFDSGTGWPSYFTTIPGVFQSKSDSKLILPRTEYHCAKCGGHHGHVFDDGPEPTGLRYCNNGVALRFIPLKA